MKKLEIKINKLFELLIKRLPEKVLAIRKENDALTFGFSDSALDYQMQKSKKDKEKFKKTYHATEFEFITAENTSISVWNGVQQGCFKHHAEGAESVYSMRGGRGVRSMSKSVLEKIWRLHSLIQCMAPYSDTDKVIAEGVVNFLSVPKARNTNCNNIVWQIGRYFYTNDANDVGIVTNPVRITDSKEVAMIWVSTWKKDFERSLEK